MSEAKLIDQAIKAKAVLESPAYQDAYAAVRQNLLEGLLATKMEDTNKAEEFRWSIKLLDALKKQLDGAVELGKIAEARLADARETSKNPLRYLFR